MSLLIHRAHGRSPEHCMCERRQNRHAESTFERRFFFGGGAEGVEEAAAGAVEVEDEARGWEGAFAGRGAI
jgi:hypothetical protein